MPLTAPQRIAEERSHPRIVSLWQALTALRSTVGFLQSGAHPDDETSAMLAALRFRDGFDIAYVCSTRGEGGQNDIGREATRDLGTLRTAEMERAADVLDMRLHWLSTSPDDTIFDFGFSKSGTETMRKWGRERTLDRFVHVLRTEKPDILCPTFLDVPGQHGHHRAMTEAAHLVMDLAADPSTEVGDLPPWTVSKLYLPAWGGGGSAYDDEAPPPEATVTVKASGVDPVTGFSYERIGQQSRAFHATQGMGRWVPAGEERDWPLHLVRSAVAGSGTDLSTGLPATLADLGVAAAQTAIEEAIDAFPNGPAIVAALAAAMTHVQNAMPVAAPEHHHRLRRKEAQLARAIRLAAGVDVHVRSSTDVLRPGGTSGVDVEIRTAAGAITTHRIVVPDGWTTDGTSLTVAADAPPTIAYPNAYDPLRPRAPYLEVETRVADVTATTRHGFEVEPLVLPRRSATLTPQTALLNLAGKARSVRIALSDMKPDAAAPAFDTPAGWTAVGESADIVLTAPADLTPGLYAVPLLLDGEATLSTRRIAYPHVAPRLRTYPAVLNLRAVDVAVPDARIGYVGGGNDNVLHWLRAIGCDARPLDDADLAGDALDNLDTLVVGVFALRTRPALRAMMDSIHAWIEAGGNFVTLYHRPSDAWDADAVPPRRLAIGTPSLRWRVTDEAADVEHLAPHHPLLTTPNPIGPDDWAGWHKERGLYFASAWDDAYTPLLSMADPGEAPHEGALLSAAIGVGRHTHCALILHHEMEMLTVGAFRLTANLVASAR